MVSWLLAVTAVVSLVVASCVGVRRRWRSFAAGQCLNSGGSAGGKVFYRTKDGRADYHFSIATSENGYRIFIFSQPDYGARESGSHVTHRLTDGARRYVCWSGPIRTVEQARTVAALWADATQEYIRTGRHF